MFVTIYLDLIIVLNILFNGMILYLTSYVLRISITKKKLFLGTIFATSIVPLQLYVSSVFLHSMIGKLTYSLIIILIAFGWKGIVTFCKSVSVFYFTSFAIGGGMLGLHYLFYDLFSFQHQVLLLTTTNLHGQEIHLSFIVISFPLIWYFTKRRMDEHVTTRIKYDQLYDVRLSILGQSITTTAYLDSGNHLVDPITKRPVVLCDASYLQQFFQKEDWDELLKSIETNDVTTIPTILQPKINIVPFQGVGGETSYLYAIKPDSISITYEETVMETSSVLVGIQIHPLTEDEKYHCLLHPKLIHTSTEICA